MQPLPRESSSSGRATCPDFFRRRTRARSRRRCRSLPILRSSPRSGSSSRDSVRRPMWGSRGAPAPSAVESCSPRKSTSQRWGARSTACAPRSSPGECERLAAAIAAPVHDVSAVNDRLEDALAWLALLDEYVGVSNTNTHLRACAGRDSRVLVAWPPEWRWPRDAQRSPWYPGTALYRQSRDGDWSGALGCLRADLLSAL